MKNKTLQMILESDHPVDSPAHGLKSILLGLPEEKRAETIDMISKLFQPYDDIISVMRESQSNEDIAQALKDTVTPGEKDG